MLEQELKQHFP